MQTFKASDMLPYHLSVEISDEVLQDIKEGKNTITLKAVFITIEQILENTDDVQVISLIVAGLFNAMQNKAYDELHPPDQVSIYLGSYSLIHWEDYREGWAEKGIRTIKAWKNKANQ